MRTNASEEDLHMAATGQYHNWFGADTGAEDLTVECKGDELERGVAQADIKSSGCTARPYPREVEHLGHDRPLWLRIVPWLLTWS